MRSSYDWRDFTFWREATAARQAAKRIAVHRQGNPGAHAIDSLRWGNDTGAYTIHRYIEDEVVYGAIPLEKHAFHVLEPRIAEQRGYRVDGVYGRRGDYDSIGIETVDVPGGGPGQEYSLTQATRISLVLVCATLVTAAGLTVEDIDEHAAYDPWTRAEDLGNALCIPDLRLDVADHLAGREPWRSVQQHAYGTPAPVAWRTGTPEREEEPVNEPLTEGQLRQVATLREWIDRDDPPEATIAHAVRQAGLPADALERAPVEEGDDEESLTDGELVIAHLETAEREIEAALRLARR